MHKFHMIPLRSLKIVQTTPNVQHNFSYCFGCFFFDFMNFFGTSCHLGRQGAGISPFCGERLCWSHHAFRGGVWKDFPPEMWDVRIGGRSQWMTGSYHTIYHISYLISSYHQPYIGYGVTQVRFRSWWFQPCLFSPTWQRFHYGWIFVRWYETTS